MKHTAYSIALLLTLLPAYGFSASLSDSSPSTLKVSNVKVSDALEQELKQSKANLETQKNNKAASSSIIQQAQNDVAAKQKAVDDYLDADCKLTRTDWDFCRANFNGQEYFEDIAVDPALTEGSELKIGVIRGLVEFGENANLPISILYSKVADTPEDGGETANAKTLLDPEQGINLAFEYGGYYSVGELCRGDTSARCFVGANLAARYLELTEEGSDTKQSTYGGLATIKALFAFNIVDASNRDNKLGTIRLDAAYSYFQHNGSDSDKYFSGITDGQGNPVKFDNSFQSLRLGAALSISKSISIDYARFKPIGGTGIKAEESLVLKFDGIEFN